MQDWLIIKEEYLNYLRSFEPKIPYSDYGKNKFKPFFGELFEKDGLVYVTQISHAQERHNKMKNAPDFRKIFLPTGNSERLVAVVNLNTMFPVPKEIINKLVYKEIGLHRTFENKIEKGKYIDLLKKEMEQINKIGIEEFAKKLYERKQKYPDDIVSKRCINFLNLEEIAKKY